MSKVIAIMDKPTDCQQCVFGVSKYSFPLTTHRKGYYCQLLETQDREVEDFDYEEEVHLSNCPLCEVPQKKTMKLNSTRKDCERVGYNKCIDDILGVD